MALPCRRTVLFSCYLCRRVLIQANRTSGQNFTSGGGREGDECDHEADGEGLQEVFQGPIPRDKLNISYSRSSGPGGQNVNKLNTKAEVRFHIESADWIPLRVKERLKSMFKARVTKQGELIVTAQKYRSQAMNLNEAVEKVERMLSEASEVAKGPSPMTRARVKALKRIAERRRMANKKYHTEKKMSRRIDDC